MSRRPASAPPRPAAARVRRGLGAGFVQSALFVAIIAASLVATVPMFREIDRLLERSRVAQTDNLTWVISQLEVDVMNLHVAVLSARLDAPPADRFAQVRETFDILYSRTLILEAGSVMRSSFPQDSRLFQDVDAIRAFLDRNVPVIDGSDAELAAALERLSADLARLEMRVRQGIVLSLEDLLRRSDTLRQDLRVSLQRFTGAALALSTLLLLALGKIVMQQNALRRRTASAEQAAHNLRATIESALDAVIVVTPTGIVEDCNHAAETMFGWTRADICGASLGRFLCSEGKLLDTLALARDTAAGRIVRSARRADGSSFPIELGVAETLDATQRVMLIAFVRDISERLEREETLRKARNDAMKGEEAKARFLATVSHEMRTPLNGLIAATELLQDGAPMTDRQRWLSDIIFKCGQSALDQVNNLLELARLSADGAEHYTVAAFSPARELGELALLHRVQAAKGGNTLDVQCAEDAPGAVVGQSELFRRVVNNFIANAIKFTENGQITVRLNHEPDTTPGHVLMCVTVTDTGIGIAPADLERIFENFETLNASNTRIREGTGLGLGIAKLAAEAMGGMIHVRSTPGKGSAFTLRVVLPVAQADTAAGQPAPAGGHDRPAAGRDEHPGALSILLAEDNPINMIVLTEMLREDGHAVTQAANGHEAVTIAAQRHFDLILMDIEMPGLDGLEATRRIRAAASGSWRSPIIAVTAHASPERIAETAAAGMNEVIVKPINRRVVKAVIAAAVRPDGTDAPFPAQNAAPQAPSAPQIYLLDLDAVTETRSLMGEDSFARLCDRALGETLDAVDGLRTALREGDIETARAGTHRLAGAVALLGMRRLHVALTGIEQALEQGTATGAALAALDGVPRIAAETRAALDMPVDADAR